MKNLETFFAPAQRASEDNLSKQVKIISQNPVIDGLMNVVSGLLAVLNENRQIIAINDALLEILEIKDKEKAFGLRPGEAINCIYANKSPGGCGTSEFCSNCGAVIAILTSILENKPCNKTCAVTINKDNSKKDLYFKVYSHPITIQDNVFILLFIQDITHYQQLAALEKVFLHDISNTVTSLMGISELMIIRKTKNIDDLIKKTHQIATRLAQEINMQKCFFQNELINYKSCLRIISIKDIIKEIEIYFANNPIACDKKFILPKDNLDLSFKTDLALFMRVLNNMLINAFEASQKDDEIKFSFNLEDKKIIFCVENNQAISKDVARRIFQRNFSSKEGLGRGLGTYSMKIFGEQFLGGKVYFDSSLEEKKTKFYFELEISKI